MELSSFSENIVTETIERNGDAVELKINIDAIVPDYFDELETRLAPLTERLEALQAKLEALQENKKGKKQRGHQKPSEKPPSLLSVEKEIALIQREAFAERLACPIKLPDGSYTQLLKDWTVTENGQHIPPTKENLIRLPPKTVVEIWERCIARTETVKKRVDEETAETSESMPSGSRALHAVAPAS